MVLICLLQVPLPISHNYNQVREMALHFAVSLPCSFWRQSGQVVSLLGHSNVKWLLPYCRTHHLLPTALTMMRHAMKLNIYHMDKLVRKRLILGYCSLLGASPM